jgi:ATP-dependent DNA ligase
MFGRNLLDGLPADAKTWLRKHAQPKWVAPMLATLTDEVFSRQGWLFEPKWDGERCLAFRRGRDLDLFSRNRIRLNAKYPEVVQAIHQQEATSFIADGEIVAFDGVITSFAKLQARMQDIALPEPPMAVAREGRVVRNLAVQSRAAGPSIQG